MSTRRVSAAELDAFLSDAPSYRKPGTVAAERLGADQTWTTAAGDELAGAAGDWLVTDDSGDQWTVGADVFAATYESAGAGRFRKTAVVQARQVTEPMIVDTLEGPASAAVGDWIARNPSGECWPIPAEVFAASYRPVD